MSSTSCEHCQQDFPSRNKLYKHLPLCVVKHQASLDVRPESELADVLSPETAGDVFIFVTGGRHRGRTLGSCERFSFRKQTWELAPYMAEQRGSHGCASYDGVAYALGGGGLGAKNNLAVCEKFDLRTGAWDKITPMRTYRHALVVLTVDAPPLLPSIFAIGGWIDGSVCSRHCERYEIR